MPHRARNERVHGQHRLRRDRPRRQGPTVLTVAKTRGQRLPDPVVGPLLDRGVVGHLQVEARHRLRTHRVKREAVGVPGVDQFVGRRRDVREDPQPGVGIDLLPRAPHVLRYGDPGRPERAVAAGHRIRDDPSLGAGRVGERDRGGTGLEVVQRGVTHLVVDLLPRPLARSDEVLLHLGLSVDPHRPTGQVDEVEVVPLAGPLQVDPRCRSPSRSSRPPSPDARSRSTVDCSRMPARIREATYSSERDSTTTDSTPSAASRWESNIPAGPAPMIATWVRTVSMAQSTRSCAGAAISCCRWTEGRALVRCRGLPPGARPRAAPCLA